MTFPSVMRLWKISFIIHWNVAGEFMSPKNMMVGSKRPRLVWKAAFSSSPSLILMLLYPPTDVKICEVFSTMELVDEL